MVNVDMFKNAFVLPGDLAPAAQQPKFIPNPNYVDRTAVAPAAAPSYVNEDPNIAKLKFLMLKWLSIIIGGSAILLIVWRVILKFI